MNKYVLHISSQMNILYLQRHLDNENMARDALAIPTSLLIILTMFKISLFSSFIHFENLQHSENLYSYTVKN